MRLNAFDLSEDLREKRKAILEVSQGSGASWVDPGRERYGRANPFLSVVNVLHQVTQL